jgi:hypothetical protein
MSDLNRSGFKKSKPQRPKIQKILITTLIGEKAVYEEKFIIVNSKGETLEAPMFSTKEDALIWLDEYHPANNYAPM